MPCSCALGACSSCACGKAGRACTAACHGGARNSYCLNDETGRKLGALSAAEVRRLCVAAGVSIIGNAAELKTALATHMREEAASAAPAAAAASSSSSSSSSSSAAAPSGATNSATVKAVIAAGEDYAALLSLSGIAVTAASPAAELRKAYLRLSLKVHPDKNGASAEARSAFQLLVTALERLAQPDGGEDGDGAGAGAGAAGGRRAAAAPRPRERVDTSVSRSNEGCFQTRVFCPRCRMDWPRKELGLEDAAYNFLMMSLKEYTCGMCMLNFGCMTAEHQCPFCKRPFEYGPSDYHRKRICGNAGCDREFGFMQHPVSARRL